MLWTWADELGGLHRRRLASQPLCAKQPLAQKAWSLALPVSCTGSDSTIRTHEQDVCLFIELPARLLQESLQPVARMC